MHLALAVLLSAPALQGQAGAGGKVQHRPEEYEFIQTETGYVLPEGMVEADLTLQNFEFEDDDDLEFTAQALVAEAAFGLTDWLMLEGRVPFRRLDVDGGDSESGIGDLEFEGKVSLTRKSSPIAFIPDGNVDVAAGLRVSVPTGDEDEGLGRENASFAPFVSASYWFDPQIGIHGRVESELQQDESPQHRATAAVEFIPWDPSFSFFGALDIRRDGSESDAITLVPGAQYRFPGMPLALGIGIPLGLNDEAPDWGVLVNGEYRF